MWFQLKFGQPWHKIEGKPDSSWLTTPKATISRIEPKDSWRVSAQRDAEDERWAVFAPGQSQPLVWGLHHGDAAIRWAQRIA